MKKQISVIDGTVGTYTKTTATDELKMDSGISTVADTTLGILSQDPLNSITNLEHIATLDGSYLKSTVTNVEQTFVELNV